MTIRLITRRIVAAATIAALLLGGLPPLTPSVQASPGPEPTVSIGAPTGVFLNEGFTLSLQFDNAGDATGFGPVVELLVPPGVDIDAGSASFLGAPVTAIDVGVFDASGILTNPLTGLDVTGPENYRLLVVEYPLGSFTDDQPAATVTLDAELNALASLGVAETFYANPLFRFGADAEDNPTVDPPIFGLQSTAEVVPTVITLQKSNDARENETATGPNYPVTYTLTVDIANLADIEDLTVTDTLPGNLQFIEVISDGGATVTEPSTTEPGGSIVFSWPGTTTGILDPDLVLEYRVYAPELDDEEDPVIDPETGSSVPATNEAQATGDYNDGTTLTPVSAQAEHTLTLRSVAMQKGVSLHEDNNAPGISPGDILEYTIEFQVSDYFAFQDIVVTDIVGDGQTFLDSFTPELSVTERGQSGTWAFTDGDTYTSYIDTPSLGQTTLVFDVTKLLDDEGFGVNQDGSLEGDEYTDGTPDGEPATGTITFRTRIDEAYENPASYPGGNEWLGAGDSTGNTVDIDANLLDTTTGVSDSSAASVTIATPTLQKSVYAIEGTTSPPDLRVAPGETVTFSLRIEVDAGETEDLVLTDYLPIPFLDVTELTTYDTTQDDDPPAAGSWKLAADDTLSALTGQPPAVSVDAAQNTVTFDWGTFHEVNAVSRVAHVLFTLTATDEPMANELYLANLAFKQCENSEGSPHAAVSVDYIVTQQPFLTITKGIADTDGGGTIDPDPAVLPVDGDLYDADADDTVTFVITVENKGGWPAHDVTITEQTPTGLSGCAIVTDGVKIDGSTTSYTGNLFSGGLVLTEALEPGEILTIEFTCTIDSDVYPRQELVNTAQVTKYTSTGESGAPNFVQDQSLYEDDATITIAEPAIEKSYVTSSEPSTTGTNLTIGEKVTFELRVTLPESEVTNLVITDDIPAGFRYEDESLEVTAVGTAVTLGSPETISPASPYAFGPGENVSITFEGLTSVSGATTITDRQVVLQLEATVLDHVSNDWLTPNKTNTVTLNWDENPGAPISDDLALTIVEPNLVVTKNMSPNPATGGQTVTITLTVSNNGTSDAFDVSVTDVLDTDVFDTSTVTDTTASLNDFTFGYSDPTVTYSGGTIAAGASQVFTFEVPVQDLVVTGSSYPNTGTADYSSLPGDETDEREYTSSGSQNLSISRTSIGKSIVATSEPNDISSGNNVVIGEVITYQVTLQLPANSTTREMRITDSFPTNVAYIPGTSVIARSSEDVTSTNFDDWAASPGDFATIAPDEEPAPVRFQLGDVVNDSDSSETITLRFDVVVRNVTDNQRGTAFQNRASVRFRTDQDQLITVNSNWVSLTIRAPSLRIDKTASPTAAIGGETVSFVIEIENQSVTNAAPVFDLRLLDPLAADYEDIANLSWVITGTGVNITDNTSGSTLDIEIDRLDPGEKVVFTFEADLAEFILHGITVPNTATLTGTSLPGDYGTGDATPGDPGTETGERTGDGGVNNLQVTDPAQVTIDLPTMDKHLLNPQSSYPIGETVTFEVTVGVPTGYSECIKIEDTLPAGLEFVPGSVEVVVPGTIDVEFTPLDESNSDFFQIDGTLYRFQFGEVEASESADIVLRYDVVVANILTNQNGTMLENSAELRKLDPSTGDCVLLVQDHATVTVGEPYVVVNKHVVSGTAGLTNEDLVDFQIDISNTGNQTAYGLVVTDEVTPDVFGDITSHSVVASFAPAPTFDPVAMELAPFDLAPGETVTLLFTAELANLTIGETITNTASGTFTSMPGGEGRTGEDGSDQDDNTTLNNYNTEGSASFQAASGVNILKEVCPSHPNDRFAIGEVVRFRIQIDILELTTTNVVVTDTLPDYLTPLPDESEVSVGNTGIWFEDPNNPGNPQPDYDVPQVAGQVLTFDLGNIHNPANGVTIDDYVIIEIYAQVQNVGENQNGEVRTNEVEVSWTEEGEPYSQTDTAVITIVEPDLEILKSVSKTELTLGDEVIYTVTVRHTANSTADAHDLVIIDTIPANMDYVTGSSSLPASQVTHDPGDPETLTFEIPLLSLADHDITFTYRCVLEYDESLADDPPVLQVNNAFLMYTSMAGDEPDEQRTGEDGIGGALNSYADEASREITPIIRTTIRAEKTVEDANGGELIGGDILIYTITLINTSGTAHNVVYTDAIPDWTTYVADSLETDKDGATVDDSGDPLIVYVGDMVEDEVVTITFRVRVYPQAPSGTVISNQGVVNSNDTTPHPTDDPDDPTSDTDPTEIIVDRPMPMPAVGGEVVRPDKGQLIKNWLLALLGIEENTA